MRLLVLASRPSDYTEMSALARALADGGHHALLIYLYAQSDPGSRAVLSSIEQLSRDNDRIIARGVDVDGVLSGTANVGDRPMSLIAEGSQAAEIGLYKLVVAFRDHVLGREGALFLRRKFPTARRLFPVVYKVARLVDVVRSLPEGLRIGWRAANVEDGRTHSLAARARMVFEGPKVIADATVMEQVYRRYRSFFAATIAAHQVSAVIIPEDIVGNLWPVAIKAAHDADIPALVFPYTLANKEEAFQGLKGEAPYQTWRNRIAVANYPRWRLIERGKDLVRLPSSHIFAHERLGISPPDPWMMNSGFADLIGVDSQASFDYFRAGGIPAEQMRIVGSPSQDQMFRWRQHRAAHVEELRRDLKLTGTKPVLLVSGCPNQLSASVPYCEFATMETLAAFVGESLAPLAEHYHLIVRAHPNYPEFGTMLERFGFASTMKPTASLVSLSDVFVAFASATIRWAIACGVPAVNYDVFHYAYGDFASAKGVVSVTSSREFRDLVRSLTPGSPALEAQAARARDNSAYWGIMDGGSVTRIDSEIQAARSRRLSSRKGEIKEQQNA